MGPSHLWHGVVFEVVVLHPVVNTKIRKTHEEQCLVKYFRVKNSMLRCFISTKTMQRIKI